MTTEDHHDPVHADDVAWCGRPPTAQELTEAAHRRAAEAHGRQVDAFARERLRHAAVARRLHDDDGSAGSATSPGGEAHPGSATAPEGAHGIVEGVLGTGRYRGWRGLVCLDCGWVGAILPLFPPGLTVAQAAEADAHRLEAAWW